MGGKVLILGSKGTLGAQLIKVFGQDAVGFDRQELDVTNFDALKSKILELKPTAIINCVAYNDVDGAEENHNLAFQLNSELPKHLAKIAHACSSVLIHFSSNYVFGEGNGQYSEGDVPTPTSVYAESKYKGEQEVINNCQKYYVVRTSVIFGPKGGSEMSKKSFVDLMLEMAGKTDTIKAVSDETNSLTYAVDLAKAVKLLLNESRPYSIYHITNSGQASWFEFAGEIFKILGKKINLVPVPSLEFPRKAQRPKTSVLINTKLPELRPWQEALNEYLNKELSIAN